MRLIDADELLIALPSPEMRVTKQLIKEAPTIDAEPVKHSHWEKLKILSLRQCHTCGHVEGYNANYCANCGAKMDLKDGESK